MIIKEKSCGIVLINKQKGKTKFLLLHYPQGHFDFPKGHIEEAEFERETAARELEEETGISVCEIKFYEGFKETINYAYKREGKSFKKEVVFFLAETSADAVKLSHEHKGFFWVDYKSARKKITFRNSKLVLEKAKIFLERQ